jgi:hypothetical protein
LKKAITCLLLLLFAYCSKAQYLDPDIRKYTAALTFTNPLSATFKYGGGVEHRFHNFAYMFTYNRYYKSLYPGVEIDLDIRIYLRKRYLWRRSGWSYQNFLYGRGIIGSAGFKGPNLTILGYTNKAELDEQFYSGGSMGFGRRFSKKIFFVTVRAGLRGIVLPDLQKEDKDLYRLFYVTGPGSVLELNFQFGIQI